MPWPSPTGASNLRFSGIAVRSSGANGIDANMTSSHVQVTDSSISDTHNNAIEISRGHDWELLRNTITSTGMIRGMGGSGDGQYNAVSYLGSNGIARNNVIKNTGYIGIHFQGSSVLVENNLIDGFCLTKSDGGGIYTYSDQTETNRNIIGNIVINGLGDRFGLSHDELRTVNPYFGNVHCIYLDGGSTNVRVHGNSLARCDASGIHFGSSQNVVATNNTLFDNNVTQFNYLEFSQPLKNLTVRDNIAFSPRIDELMVAFDLHPGQTQWIDLHIDHNIYSRPGDEPTNVTTTGYNHGTPTNALFDYMDHGIAQVITASSQLGRIVAVMVTGCP